jgi:NADH-quinone oxidoreductase subunit L
MFRTAFMTFHGEYRGKPAEHGHGGHGGLHESPRVMLIPMFILGALAIGSGWINVNGWFGRFFGGHHEESAGFFFTVFSHGWLPITSLIIAILGALLAFTIYIRRQPSGESVGNMLPIPYKIFSRKYWIDELYEGFIVVRVLIDGIFRVIQLFDTYIVDGLVNGVAGVTLAGGRQLRKAQTGLLQLYALVIFLGILIIVGFVYWLGG